MTIREPSGRCRRRAVLLQDPPRWLLPQKLPEEIHFRPYFWNHFLPFHSCSSLSLNDTLAVAWVAARHLLFGFPFPSSGYFQKTRKTFFHFFKSFEISETSIHFHTANTCFRKLFLSNQNSFRSRSRFTRGDTPAFRHLLPLELPQTGFHL